MEHGAGGARAAGAGADGGPAHASAWARSPVPRAGRLTHTGDKPAPRIKPKAAGAAPPARVKRQGAAQPAAATVPRKHDPHFPPGLPAQLRTPPDCPAAWGTSAREAQGVLQAGGLGHGDVVQYGVRFPVSEVWERRRDTKAQTDAVPNGVIGRHLGAER